ncbi:hypothetical protein A2U01_0010766 [Trifolium medium]|uniref:Uncharacterized protein n=1 Tax=Trifolium medium TaxID=97028 RepID=A0A392MRI9_9FABA|nr:hypothetical protein [Trifolium medium]
MQGYDSTALAQGYESAKQGTNMTSSATFRDYCGYLLVFNVKWDGVQWFWFLIGSSGHTTTGNNSAPSFSFSFRSQSCVSPLLNPNRQDVAPEAGCAVDLRWSRHHLSPNPSRSPPWTVWLLSFCVAESGNNSSVDCDCSWLLQVLVHGSVMGTLAILCFMWNLCALLVGSLS